VITIEASALSVDQLRSRGTTTDISLSTLTHRTGRTPRPTARRTLMSPLEPEFSADLWDHAQVPDWSSIRWTSEPTNQQRDAGGIYLNRHAHSIVRIFPSHDLRSGIRAVCTRATNKDCITSGLQFLRDFANRHHVAGDDRKPDPKFDVLQRHVMRSAYVFTGCGCGRWSGHGGSQNNTVDTPVYSTADLSRGHCHRARPTADWCEIRHIADGVAT